MDGFEIRSAIQFLSQSNRAFSLDEVSYLVDSESAKNKIVKILGSNKNFIFIDQGQSDASFYVSQAALFNWYLNLNGQLAKSRIDCISNAVLVNKFSSLRLEGKWAFVPPFIYEFGARYGLISSAWRKGSHYFPIAHILSYAPYFDIDQIIWMLAEIWRENATPNSFANASLQLIETEGLSEVTDRDANIIRARYGLSINRKSSLDALGSKYKLTRERIRQIDNEFIEHIRTYKRHRIAYMVALICKLLQNHGQLVYENIDSHLSFTCKCIGVPIASIPFVDLRIMGAEQNMLSRVRMARESIQLYPVQKIGDFIYGKGVRASREEVTSITQQLADYFRNHYRNAHKAYIALKKIGRPAHYTKIAETYRELFNEYEISDESIHVVLLREERGIVWIGRRGTYALEEWGYERPKMTLFQSVEMIVNQVYEKTGKPVPLATIIAEMGRYRKSLSPTSVHIVASWSPALRKIRKDTFVPIGSEDDISTDVLSDKIDAILNQFMNDRKQK